MNIYYKMPYHKMLTGLFFMLWLEPCKNKGTQMAQKQVFFWYLDNSLSKNEKISFQFYYKVPYHKRKTEIDFWGCDLSQVTIIGHAGARNKNFFKITVVKGNELLWNCTTSCHTLKGRLGLFLDILTGTV